MNTEAFFLVAAVAGAGVLHTIVPDHWVPITLIARQRDWSKRETAAASFKAGIGHVLSTLAIGLVVWIGGVAFVNRFGSVLDTAVLTDPQHGREGTGPARAFQLSIVRSTFQT